MKYSKSEINKAGNILKCSDSFSEDEVFWAEEVLTYLRLLHIPVLNTFQATFRTKIKRKKYNGFVAQRLKRVSSITSKLQREGTMQLSRMQDIAGIRVVLTNIKELERFCKDLNKTKSKHILKNTKNYIENPKTSGYRGIHHVYTYQNETIESNGLLIEVQIRTKTQHAWATAVETLGTFLSQSLKSSEGAEEILNFFKISSMAFALNERQPIHENYSNFSNDEILKLTISEYNRLKISEKLQGFTVAANAIKEASVKHKYFIITLNILERRVKIDRYTKDQVEKANIDYTNHERNIGLDGQKQVVLVSMDSIEQLKKAYPNYFLDTREFIKKIEKIKLMTV